MASREETIAQILDDLRRGREELLPGYGVLREEQPEPGIRGHGGERITPLWEAQQRAWPLFRGRDISFGLGVVPNQVKNRTMLMAQMEDIDRRYRFRKAAPVMGAILGLSPQAVLDLGPEGMNQLLEFTKAAPSESTAPYSATDIDVPMEGGGRGVVSGYFDKRTGKFTPFLEDAEPAPMGTEEVWESTPEGFRFRRSPYGATAGRLTAEEEHSKRTHADQSTRAATLAAPLIRDLESNLSWEGPFGVVADRINSLVTSMLQGANIGFGINEREFMDMVQADPEIATGFKAALGKSAEIRSTYYHLAFLWAHLQNPKARSISDRMIKTIMRMLGQSGDPKISAGVLRRLINDLASDVSLNTKGLEGGSIDIMSRLSPEDQRTFNYTPKEEKEKPKAGGRYRSEPGGRLRVIDIRRIK